MSLLRDAYREGAGYNMDYHQWSVYDSLRGYEPFDEFMRPRD